MRGLPRIQYVGDFQVQLPVTALYVGAGHPKLKLPKSCLAAPYVSGVDGEPEYCLALFAKQVEKEKELQEVIKEMALDTKQYAVLVVDTLPGHPSHAEVLARAFWQLRRTAGFMQEAQQPQVAAATSGPRVIPPIRKVPVLVLPTAKKPRPTTKLPPPRPKILPGMIGVACPTLAASCEAHVFRAWRWSDVEIHRAIRKMFRPEVLQGVTLPPLEDLVNDERLAAWRSWAQGNGCVSNGLQAHRQQSGWESLAVGRQRGATGSKHAVLPTVGFGMAKMRISKPP